MFFESAFREILSDHQDPNVNSKMVLKCFPDGLQEDLKVYLFPIVVWGPALGSYVHVCFYSVYIHTRKYTDTRNYSYTYHHSDTPHTHTCTYMHNCIYIHTLASIHTHMHTHTHIRTRTHMCTPKRVSRARCIRMPLVSVGLRRG